MTKSAPAASGGPTDSARTEPARTEPALRRLTWILVLGALAPALDATIVNVGLAAVGRGLHTTVSVSQWTITGYLLAMAIAMPVTRWSTEQIGRASCRERV